VGAVSFAEGAAAGVAEVLWATGGDAAALTNTPNPVSADSRTTPARNSGRKTDRSTSTGADTSPIPTTTTLAAAQHKPACSWTRNRFT